MTEDQALVSKVLSGDMQAFRLLIKQHERLVVHMIGRVVKSDVEREELCQDVFLRVLDKLNEFTFQSRLSTWIATIAYRHAINHLRKRKILLSEIPDEEQFTQRFVEPENPESLFSDQDMNEFVLKMIEKGFVNEDTQSIFKRHSDENKYASLKWGLIIFFAGLSLIVLEYIEFDRQSPLPYGVFAVSVSLGFLIYYFLVKKENK